MRAPRRNEGIKGNDNNSTKKVPFKKHNVAREKRYKKTRSVIYAAYAAGAT